MVSFLLGEEEGCKVDGETGLARAGGAHDHHHLVFAAVERRVHTGPLLYRVAAPVCVWVGLQNGKSHNGKWVGKGRRQKQKVCGCGWVYGIFRNGIPKCLIEFPQLIDRYDYLTSLYSIKIDDAIRKTYSTL